MTRNALSIEAVGRRANNVLLPHSIQAWDNDCWSNKVIEEQFDQRQIPPSRLSLCWPIGLEPSPTVSAHGYPYYLPICGKASRLTCLLLQAPMPFESIVDFSGAIRFHSFIQTISIAPLQVHYCSEALPTQHGYCAKVSRQSAASNCR